MNDALLVRRFQRLRNLLRDGKDFIEWQRSTCDSLREILALDKSHDKERSHPPLLTCLTYPALFQPVDRRDVGMVEGCEGFGFALKAQETCRIVGQ